MKKREKRCLFCGGRYRPRPNLGGRQKACFEALCLVKRKREADRFWHRRNRTLHLQMIRDWFLAHPHYLKEYRLQHPEHRRKNIEATLERRREKGCLIKRRINV